jgi:hypothetical protein
MTQGADRSSSLTRRRTRSIAIAVGLLALAVFAASCSGGSSNSSKPAKPSPTAATQQAAAKPVGPEVAVADYVQGQGVEYAGDCATATLPQDKGKWCFTLLDGATSNDQKVYGVGPVGEKPVKVITTKRHGSAELTPGFQVGVADGNVGNPSQLTREQLAADTFITGNLVLDQAAGIGNGLADLPAGAPGPTPPAGGGGNGGGTPATPAALPPVVVDPGALPADYVPPPLGIVVENPTIQVLGEVVFRGAGCAASEPLQVIFDGTRIGSISADPSGKFAGSISVPPGTAPGTHAVTVRGAICSFNTTITVLGGKLAFTGSSSHTGTYVLGALAAIVVGFVLVVGTRRRRRVSGSRDPSAAA